MYAALTIFLLRAMDWMARLSCLTFLAGAAVGVFFLLRGKVKNRFRPALRKTYFAAMIVSMLAPIIWIQLYDLLTDAVTEYNPHSISEKIIVGEWRKGASVLQINPDGSFGFNSDFKKRHSTASSFNKGLWELDDWNLRLSRENGEFWEKWRVVIFAGQYRIVYDIDVDLHRFSYSKH